MSSNLTTVTIPNTVKHIGNRAFSYSELQTIKVPDSVTYLGAESFRYCKKLTDIVLHNSIDSISRATFYDCAKLETITLPNSVTSINAEAFRNCTELTQIDIPESVISIGENSFNGCSKLTSIYFPNSIDSIGTSAFHGCTKLDSVFCKATTPPKAQNGVFDDNTLKGTLFVPQGYKKAYKTVDPWRNFWSIEEINTGDIIDNTYRNNIKVSVSNNTIVVTGICSDTIIEVIDTYGHIVYRGCSTTVSNLCGGLYIVKVGNTAVKVLV